MKLATLEAVHVRPLSDRILCDFRCPDIQRGVLFSDVSRDTSSVSALMASGVSVDCGLAAIKYYYTTLSGN
jgi:hypothetical protein